MIKIELKDAIIFILIFILIVYCIWDYIQSRFAANQALVLQQINSITQQLNANTQNIQKIAQALQEQQKVEKKTEK